MDIPKPPKKPEHLLNDLESIRRLLEPDAADPPLLTESVDPQSIPLLSDIVTPAPPVNRQPTEPSPTAAAIGATLRSSLHPGARELNRLEGELRAAAQLLLQDVIDDFVPQIEAELQRRLESQLDRLLAQRKR